jgi:pimeloyl-ACP methyl ester carboxylesterase
MGAHAMVDAAAISGRFARLVLCDPTIPAPESYENPSDFAGFEGDMHPAVKRYNAFKSVDEMIERLLEKGAYHLFDRRVLEDYCRFGLLPDQDGNLRLACPPEIEASVYMSARSNGGVFESVRALEIPVTVLRARVPPADRGLADFASSPTWPGLAGQFKHGREIHYPDVTHFIPMQIPGEVERVIREEIEAWTA